MKKFLVAIIALLYLVTTSGVVVTIHYCMGKISSHEFGAAKVDFCSKCGMKEAAKAEGCCHTENKIYKLDDSHNFVKLSSNFTNKIIWAEPVVVLSPEKPVEAIAQSLASPYHSPPDHRSTSVYLFNSVFRI